MLFFAKKLPNAQARGRRCVCGCDMVLDGNDGVRAAGVWRGQYGNGGVQAAAVWRLCLTCLTCRTCLTSWCVTVYPVSLHAAVWFGAGDDMPPGYACLMATVVCGRKMYRGG